MPALRSHYVQYQCVGPGDIQRHKTRRHFKYFALIDIDMRVKINLLVFIKNGLLIKKILLSLNIRRHIGQNNIMFPFQI